MDSFKKEFNLPDADDLKEMVENGDISAVEYMVRVKELAVYVDSLISDDIKNMAVLEADRTTGIPGKIFEAFGAKLQTKSTAGTYDYSVCHDAIYNKMELDIKTLNKEMKEREKFLKKIPNATPYTTEDGKLIYAPIRHASRLLFVSLLHS